MIKKGLSAVVF